jgi:hypothetical protein
MREYGDKDDDDGGASSIAEVTVKWRNGNTETYANVHPDSGIEDNVLLLYSADPAQPNVFIPGLGSGEVVEITQKQTPVMGGGSGPLPLLSARAARRPAAMPLRPSRRRGPDGDGHPRSGWKPAIVQSAVK